MTDLQIAKSKLNILDYIPGTKTKKANYIFINPCPICGRRDHFVISNNRFYSFSGCCKGGSIIDWFVLTENVNFKEAKEKIFKLSNVDEEKMTYQQKIERKNVIEKQEKIDKLFDLLFNNLIFTFKALKKIKEKYALNEFGIWLYNFCDFWSEEFINSDDKQKTIYYYKTNLKTEINHYLFCCKKNI